MTTVNVYVLYVIWHSFLERTAPDSPLVKLLLRENCAYLIKFGEVDTMQAELTRYFPDTLNRVNVRTIKRQKVESIVPTNSQRVSKNPLTSPAYTVEADLYRPARRSMSFA